MRGFTKIVDVQETVLEESISAEADTEEGDVAEGEMLLGEEELHQDHDDGEVQLEFILDLLKPSWVKKITITIRSDFAIQYH